MQAENFENVQSMEKMIRVNLDMANELYHNASNSSDKLYIMGMQKVLLSLLKNYFKKEA